METTDVLKLLASNPPGSFLDFGSFNGRNFGTSMVTGVSPVWEMHPDTDEFFYILEGCVEITLLEADEPTHYVASAGTAFVVPQGIWHKPGAPDGAKFIYFTPGQTLHSDSPDPRTQHDA